jgi:transposase
MTSLIYPDVNAHSMSLFLAQAAREFPDDDITMVMDGAGWHHAHELIIPPSITLHFLPPYCPELNPAEQLWRDLRKGPFANRAFDSLEAVIQHLAQSVHAMHQEHKRIQQLCGFDWIVNIC